MQCCCIYIYYTVYVLVLVYILLLYSTQHAIKILTLKMSATTETRATYVTP